MTKTLYAEFTVKPGHEARVAEMTATLTTHVRNEPGNLLFNAYTRARGCGVHRARRRANRITREAQALRPSGRVRQRRPDHRHRKGQVAREGGFAPTTRRDRHRRPTVTTMRLWPFGSRRPRSQRRNQPSEPARCPRCAAHRRRTRPHRIPHHPGPPPKPPPPEPPPQPPPPRPRRPELSTASSTIPPSTAPARPPPPWPPPEPPPPNPLTSCWASSTPPGPSAAACWASANGAAAPPTPASALTRVPLGLRQRGRGLADRAAAGVLTESSAADTSAREVSAPGPARPGCAAPAARRGFRSRRGPPRRGWVL